MRVAGHWIGGELFLGAVYGLGMSIAVWIPLNSGALVDGRLLLLCVAAACAGLSRSWAGWPAPASLPWVTVAWLLGGPAPALLVGVISALGSRLIAGRRRASARLAFDAGATALAVAAASGVAQRFGASPILFAVTFVLISLALHGLRRRLVGAARGRVGRDLLLTLALCVAGLPAVEGIAWVWSQPAFRPLLFVAPALRLGWLAGSWFNDARRRQRGSGQPLATERLLDRAAAALAQAQPEGSAGGHLWRTAALCNAIGERLGSDPDEIRCLNHAALLHHAGRLAHRDEQVEIHPRVVEETVTQLGFPAAVRTILSDMHEHWNGQGPRGRRGEHIDRGARILAVADEYDQAAHGPTSARGHLAAMAALRGSSGKRFDPLVLEILDELSEKLEATRGDLTRRFDLASSRTAVGSRLVDGERDLQTIYSIERATELPIGMRERWTLIAGLLRRMVPFSHLRIETNDETNFDYGDHAAGPIEESFRLIDAERAVGRLTLSFERAQTLDAPRRERLQRITTILARMLVEEDASQRAASLTDPATGLPNARFLRRSLALRIPAPGHAGPGFGLLALHPRNARDEAPISDAALKIVAARLASACDTHETLVRFGPEQFIVVTPESRGGELVRRWHQLVDASVEQPVELDGRTLRVRLDGAHAAHPLDGERLEELLCSLEARLTCSESASVVPFRQRQAG